MREAPPNPSVSLPEGFHESLFLRNVSENPTVAFAPDGRLFVADQGGELWVVKDGRRLDRPFLSVDADYSPVDERGLVGVAFDPAFGENGFVYVYYTVNTVPAHARLSRFTADPQNPDLAVAGSELVLLELDPQVTVFHQGGAIHFGPDGTLYIGTGDNIGGNTSQSLTTTHGKILRVNRDGSIPQDNPFLDRTSGVYQAIWGYGLRNAFAFAIQPGTGRMYINDTSAMSDPTSRA